ncbi:MAG: hypothetical protein UX55_C0013G0014 [Candidatus Azambacteria bacterium GW2011_GWE2_46_45]|uniref:Uncharacterized protein n=1 Tax=Candidatus Azambacteria bacterium GW2011_GWE2_46_45 TaxID=1618625 RepID=A0A0G1Q5F6_9BACT|nr:MAG: hypothetical protein UX55_C0013G0014 [Candidatus Azambacteria bacterium GW2011_GWE2_46_45]
MGVAGQEMFHRVLFARGDADRSFAAAFLHPVSRGFQPLDVAAVSQNDDRFFLGNQILFFEFSDRGSKNFGSSVVPVFAFEFQKFFFYRLQNFLRIREKQSQLFDELFLFLEFVFYFFSFKSGERLQFYFQNGVGLDFGEFEFFEQILPGFVLIGRFFDCFDDCVNLIKRFVHAFQNVGAFFGSGQIEF